MAAGLFPARGKSGQLTANSRYFGGSVAVEIEVLDHAGEHLSSQPESAVVEALADASLQVRYSRIEQTTPLSLA